MKKNKIAKKIYIMIFILSFLLSASFKEQNIFIDLSDYICIFNNLEVKYGKVISSDLLRSWSRELLDKDFNIKKGVIQNVSKDDYDKARTELANYLWKEKFEQNGYWTFEKTTIDKLNKFSIIQNNNQPIKCEVNFMNFKEKNDEIIAVFENSTGRNLEIYYNISDNGFINDKNNWKYSFTNMVYHE